MLAQDLPFEIIVSIVGFLGYKDKINCMDAISTWGTALEESLWNNINIYSQRSLDKICNINSTKHSAYKRNGCHVKTLTLNGDVCIDDRQLLAIQRLLPNLECLYSANSCISEEEFGKQSNWRLWRSLTQLHIDLTDWEDVDPIREFMGIFPFLSHLKILKLDQDYGDIYPSLSLEEIDKIHDYMPRLEIIKLDIQPPVLTADDLVRITQVTPAPNLRTARFNVRNSVYGWLCYFAFKYPNLQTLEELTFKNNEPNELWQPSELILKSHPAVFQYLNTVKINAQANTGQLEPAIWRFFRLFKIPIKYIDYFAYSYVNIPVTVQDAIKNSFNYFANTLETLYIKECHGCGNNWIITKDMNLYPCLVDIYIDAHRSSVAVNVLLDKCPSLQRLKIESGLMFIGPDESVTSKTHPLRMLIIGRLSISADILNYISFRCKFLEHMCLNKSMLSGNISKDTGSLVIDMSHTHFRTLQLHQVLFTTFLDAKHESHTISLINIAQTMAKKDHYFDRTIDEEPSRGRVFNRDPRSSWFYTLYKDFYRDEWTSEVWNLTQSEAKFATKYFSHFNANPFKEALRSCTGNGYITKNNWKSSLSDGYVLLKCASFSQHTITGKWFSNEHVWQKIFEGF
ncbi:hypothetical protein CLU79DRAFT_780377 [Phycomyces nitens]|nr:hypothetical protein CLU79DRAFT_780377 [Phycomyces nitens]